MDLEAIYFLNKGFHVLAAMFGLFAATAVEFLYLKSVRDGQLSAFWQKAMHWTYKIMRLSMIILIITGIGFFINWQSTSQGVNFFNDPVILAKYAIILILIVNAILLQIRKMPIWLGSPLSLVSWYAAAFLGKLLEEKSEIKKGSEVLISLNDFSPIVAFVLILVGYFIAVAITGFILQYIVKKLKARRISAGDNL